jgi:hypothetical protein
VVRSSLALFGRQPPKVQGARKRIPPLSPLSLSLFCFLFPPKSGKKVASPREIVRREGRAEGRCREGARLNPHRDCLRSLTAASRKRSRDVMISKLRNGVAEARIDDVSAAFDRDEQTIYTTVRQSNGQRLSSLNILGHNDLHSNDEPNNPNQCHSNTYQQLRNPRTYPLKNPTRSIIYTYPRHSHPRSNRLTSPSAITPSSFIPSTNSPHRVPPVNLGRPRRRG